MFGNKIHLKKLKDLVESESNNPAFTDLGARLQERKLVGLKGVIEQKTLDAAVEEANKKKEEQEIEKEEAPKSTETNVVSSVPRIADKVPAGKTSSSVLSSALKKIIAAQTV